MLILAVGIYYASLSVNARLRFAKIFSYLQLMGLKYFLVVIPYVYL
jgi:hypothetical protein